MKRYPPLAVSVGCPAGIGPQVALEAAAHYRAARCVLVGDARQLRTLAARLNIDAQRLQPLENDAAISRLTRGQIGLWQAAASLPRPIRPGHPTRAAGVAQLRWIDQACALVENGHCDALITGPVSKEVIARGSSPAAKRFRGHTEHLARRLSSGHVVMAFHGSKLAVSLATTHLPLRRVAASLTHAAVHAAIVELAKLLQRLGKSAPQLVVTGLNPHAGEGGLLGDEETTIIAPAIRKARTTLKRNAVRRNTAQPEPVRRNTVQESTAAASVSGPWGAESAFRAAAAGRFDGVVAMYHDQATIACKLVGFGDMVNVTLGLPIVRVSVDHGTAYDRAACYDASYNGMLAALKLGRKLTGRTLLKR